MSYKISKELFEQVTGYEGTIHEYNRECIINGDVEEHISINDFFFMCKEWVLKQGYSILSGKDDIYEQGNGFVCSIGNSTLLIKDFYSDSEQQAVFDACQWILDNKDKQ